MKFGTNLAFMRAEHRLATAQVAEAAGFESVWMPDHLVLPLESNSYYPFNDDHRSPLPPHSQLMDPLLSLAYFAGGTTTIRFGIAVYLLPLRDLISTARSLVTLDVLSGGRLLFGAGVGWMREEYDIVGADFEHRGTVMNEYIDALRVLWTAPEPEFHGAHLDFAPLAFEPKPTHPGGPPIIIGGETPAALRRAATRGDGWIGVGHTPESAAAIVDQLRALREAAGRAELPFEVTVAGRIDAPEDVQAFADAGVDRIIVTPWTRPRDAGEGLRAFGDDVIAKLPRWDA